MAQSAGKLLNREDAEAPTGFRATHISHELGHAKDYESVGPRLRKFIQVGVPLVGGSSILAGAATGDPVHAALGALLAASPTLVDEVIATRNASRGLREAKLLSPDERQQVHNTLLTAADKHIGEALAGAGVEALGAHMATQPGAPKLVSFAPAMMSKLVGSVLHNRYAKINKESPMLSPEEAEQLRSTMGVRAGIYPASDELAKQEKATYREGKPVFTGIFNRGVKKQLANGPFQGEQLKKIREEGGVIAPRYPMKKKASAEWSQLARALVL